MLKVKGKVIKIDAYIVFIKYWRIIDRVTNLT